MRSAANMLPSGPGLHSDAKAAPRQPRRWWLMPLLFVTTARFKAEAAIDPGVGERIRLAEKRGWTVRTAGPRNYLACTKRYSVEAYFARQRSRFRSSGRTPVGGLSS